MFLFISTTFWVKALQFVLSLSFLVFVHELGHFLFARLFKVRVEKFYLFFNPNFSLFRAKKINGRWQFKFFAPNVPTSTIEQDGVIRPMTPSELDALPPDDWRRYPDSTEWGIGWVPLGGYCSIAGMVDERKALTDLPSEPQPWEFRTKKAWQRFFIITGGVMVNFVSALILFGLIIYFWGTAILPLKNVTDGLYYSELLVNEGFQQGDKIVSVDGHVPTTLSDAVHFLIIDGYREVVVERGGKEVQLSVSPDLSKKYLAAQNEFDFKEREKARNDANYTKKPFIFIGEAFPFVIDSVLPNTVAEGAHLQKNDHIIAINDAPTPSFYAVSNELQKYPCENIKITYVRANDTLTTGAFLGDACLLGVLTQGKYNFYQIEQQQYTLTEAFPAGIQRGLSILTSYVKQFRFIFSKEGAQSLGGFAAIGNMFSPIWDWESFWSMTAFLSIILAFMNILPIPGLDGAYMLFILAEMLTGKQPSEKFLERANTIGFWVLLLLLIVANGNDILKIFM